ncbi:uncharacterized protein Z518_07544 [Rhinocladiella mackenziei CBS 650.93]|uniref:Mitochondrial division protein 1 n=1 Tax=Rhinocladiella mackenziei CBS 650.93 TaxID=1442369 RepID=A0A0D2ILB6_9EURO|nr:uncharacterized protein Z518_07544 [Rhinocladiella mackenziei CBS 650.93]KIX03991.1 hypothetical protein Z518_07544 [Rhinocladiella mackenziei CBS 650.93]
MAQPAKSSNAISELVEHFRLDAQCHDDHTLVSLPVRGRRGEKRQEKWTRIKALGQGSFGIVWLEQKVGEDTKEVRAIKEIRKGMGHRLSFNIDYARELYAMARLTRHTDYFAEFYGWYENDGAVFLSMEYFPHGDLANCIRAPVLESEAQEIVRQLLAGLQVIHEHGITHRDLKPQNIFVVEKSPTWWVKIGDFGISKRIGGNSTYLHTAIGTELFMAPEVLDEDNLEGYTNAVDIWALGCVLYLLLAWTTPFPVKKSIRLYAAGKIECPIQPLRDQGATLAAVTFAEMLLAAHPEDRPSAKDARQLPWMSIDAGHGELTEQTLEVEMHVGTLEQEQLHRQPENRASLGRPMSANDTSSQSLNSLQTTLPAAVQEKQVVDLPTKISAASPPAIQPSPLPQSTSIVSATDPITIVRHSTLEDVQGQSRALRKVSYRLGELYGHRGSVRAVAFSPDGTTIVSGSGDRSVRIWDATTGGQLRVLTGHRYFVNSVAFSPDGTTIASGSGDRLVRIWDAATGTQLWELAGHTDPAYCVAFSPNGTTIASGSVDRSVRIWDAATGTQLRKLAGHRDLVSSVAFSPDGTTIASGSRDKSVRIWDAATGTPLWELTGHKYLVNSVAFSPDGTTIASGSGDRSVRIWDATTGTQLRGLVGHTDPACCVAFSPNGTTIASGSVDRSVRIWDAATGTPLRKLAGHRDWVNSVAFSPDGTTIASGSRDQSVRIWNVAVE